MEAIVQNHREVMTFEDFASQVFSPSPGYPTSGTGEKWTTLHCLSSFLFLQLPSFFPASCLSLHLTVASLPYIFSLLPFFSCLCFLISVSSAFTTPLVFSSPPLHRPHSSCTPIVSDYQTTGPTPHAIRLTSNTLLLPPLPQAPLTPLCSSLLVSNGVFPLQFISHEYKQPC